MYVDDDVGKCERIHNCGYHYPPREYFNKINHLNNNKMKKINSTANSAEQEKKQQIDHVLPERLENSMMYQNEEAYPICALYVALAATFGRDAVHKVFIEYDVRVTTRYKKDGMLGVVFIQKKQDGIIRQVKEMGYNPKTGRRLKEGEDVQVWRYGCYKNDPTHDKIYQVGRYLMGDYNFEAKQCFFGEHLLSRHLNKPVAIVESEKTAIIASISNPEYLWLATGGFHGCKWYCPDVYEVLRGRKVILFPDLKAEQEWGFRASTMKSSGIDVSLFDLKSLPVVTQDDIEDGLDIGDLYIRLWQQTHPEAGTTIENEVEVACPKAEETELVNMFSALPPAPRAIVTTASSQRVIYGNEVPLDPSQQGHVFQAVQPFHGVVNPTLNSNNSAIADDIAPIGANTSLK
jgi:hypothetical protein